MFGHSILSRINIIISDGDAQEYGQIDNAIKKFLPQVRRVRCGWHIIEKGWQRKMLNRSVFVANPEVYDQITNNIKSWMYSWMKGQCESQHEYEISKKLLMKYVQSEYVITSLGEIFTKAFLTFFRQCIEPFESDFLFHLRKDLRHYAEYSNSTHEGTNRGLKYNAAPVTPATRLDNSTVILTKNAVRSSIRNAQKSARS